MFKFGEKIEDNQKFNKEKIKENYLESFRKFQDDIENKKIGSHYSSLEFLSSILDNGIYSVLDMEDKLKKEKNNEDRPYHYKYSDFQDDSERKFSGELIPNIDKYIDDFGKEFVLNNLESLIFDDDFVSNKYAEAFGNSFDTMKRMQYINRHVFRKESQKKSPRLEYYIKNVLPKYIENNDVNYSKIHKLTDRMFAHGLISTQSPEATRIHIKNGDGNWGEYNSGIFFDEPHALLTYPLGHTQMEYSKDEKQEIQGLDLGISSKIKPYRFKAIGLFGKYDKESNCFEFPIKINADKIPKKSMPEVKEDIINLLKKLLGKQIKDSLPLIDENYKLIPLLDSISLKINITIKYTSSNKDAILKEGDSFDFDLNVGELE